MNTKIIKLTLPSESVLLICLNCLSWFSILSFVYYLLRLMLFFILRRLLLFKGGKGYDILICIDSAGICCGIWASFDGITDGDPQSWATGRGVRFSNRPSITIIRWWGFETHFHLIELCGRHCCLLAFLILYSCMWSRSDWAFQSWRSFLKSYYDLPVWREDKKLGNHACRWMML